MTGVPVSPPILAIGASLCCAIALVALAHERTSTQRTSLRWTLRADRIAARSSWPVILVALSLGADTVVASFAILSTAWLATFLAAQRIRASRDPVASGCCLLCVPLQYAFVVAGRYDLFATIVPLMTVIALPLWSLAQGERRALVERVAERHRGVMAFVYCASHLPALLMLEAAGRGPSAVGTLVFAALIALATQCSYAVSITRAASRDALHDPVPARIARAAVVAAPAIVGVALSAITPFSPIVAGSLASVAALAGAMGCRVLTCVRRDVSRANPGRESFVAVALRPDALVFAAPAFFYTICALERFA